MIKNIPSSQPSNISPGITTVDSDTDASARKKARLNKLGTDNPIPCNTVRRIRTSLSDESIDFEFKQPSKITISNLPSRLVKEDRTRAHNCVPEDVLKAYLALDISFVSDRSKAFDSKKPFIFVKLSQNSDSQKETTKLLACSPYYDYLDRNNINGEPRAIEVYYASRFDGKVHSLGLINDLDSDTYPLAHHLLMINDDIFLPNELDRSEYNESVAAGAIFFEIGLYVDQNMKQAYNLLASLDQEEQASAFGGVFLEAVGEGQLDVAMRCIDHGASLNSRDKDGHLALFSSLRPGLEVVLDHLLASAANKWNVKALKEILDPLNDWDRDLRAKISAETIKIVERHIDRLNR